MGHISSLVFFILFIHVHTCHNWTTFHFGIFLQVSSWWYFLMFTNRPLWTTSLKIISYNPNFAMYSLFYIIFVPTCHPHSIITFNFISLCLSIYILNLLNSKNHTIIFLLYVKHMYYTKKLMNHMTMTMMFRYVLRLVSLILAKILCFILWSHWILSVCVIGEIWIMNRH